MTFNEVIIEDGITDMDSYRDELDLSGTFTVMGNEVTINSEGGPLVLEVEGFSAAGMTLRLDARGPDGDENMITTGTFVLERR